jgi:hypothetical protein
MTVPKSTGELLAQLDAAFKGIVDISSFGDSILQPRKFDQFVRRMEDRTVVLPDARFIAMDSPKVDIDLTGFVGRILHSGSDDSGASRTLSEGEFVEPTPQTNQLDAQELQAVTSIRDRALRRNIERGGFENTLIDLFGEAAGRDFEEYALLGHTAYSHTDDDVLSKTDGWIVKAGQRVVGGDGQFVPDGGSDLDPELLFQAMLNALPKRYLQNVSDWRFYVPWNILDAYRDKLRARGTNLGDTAQTAAGGPISTGSGGAAVLAQLSWKGIPVVFCPLLERARPLGAVDFAANGGKLAGQVALLSNPDNMAWGVFHEVTVEQEREAKHRRTDYVLTFEGDVHYEDENAAVAAFIEKEDGWDS